MATTVNDVISSSVLKLDVSEMNWAVFLLHFKTTIQGKKL